MAKLCSHCGAFLSKDDARFCHVCGRPLVPQPAASPSPGGRAPALREQVAFQPFTPAPVEPQQAEGKSAQHPRTPETKARPGQRTDIATPSPTVAWPDPLTHVSVGEVSPNVQNFPPEAAQQDFSPVPAPSSTRQEPPVNAGDQEDEEAHALPAPAQKTSSAHEETNAEPHSTAIEEHPTLLLKASPEQPNAEQASTAIEDHPTLLLEASSEQPNVEQASTAIEDRSTLVTKAAPERPVSEAEPASTAIEDHPTLLMKASSAPADSAREADAQALASSSSQEFEHEDRDVERFDTVYLANVQPLAAAPTGSQSRQDAAPPRERAPLPSPTPSWSGFQPVPAPAPGVSATLSSPPQQQVSAPTQPSLPPGGQPGYSTTSAPTGAGTRAPSAPVALRRVPPRLLIACAALVLLVLVGSLVVISLTQHGADNPWKDFSDTNLGFSARYPIDWSVKADKGKSQVQFADANQTALFTVTVANAQTDAKQFARQQAEKVGLADIQDVQPLSFAGATWQGVRGTLTIDGVKYQMRFLAATHGNRLYLLAEQATNATYNDNERLFFSQMRNSWKFS